MRDSAAWDKRAFELRAEVERRYDEGCLLADDGLKVEEWLARLSTDDLFKIMTMEWPVMSWEWRFVDELFNRIPFRASGWMYWACGLAMGVMFCEFYHRAHGL